jgi:hypothetical protein
MMRLMGYSGANWTRLGVDECCEWFDERYHSIYRHLMRLKSVRKALAF